MLGYSRSRLFVLLSKGFTLLVLVAFGVAVPLAYYTMSRWLEDFPYRIELSWSIFLAVGLIALVITLLTVSYHALKAALSDPIQSLRYE